MNFLSNLLSKSSSSSTSKISYAQSGEDLIIDFLFSWMKVAEIKYLDIGANHPSHFSNTYLFYKKGMNGVLVEADPSLCKELNKERPSDNILNLAISPKGGGEISLYVMTASTLNTLSLEKAQEIQSGGRYKIKKIVNVRQVEVMDIVEEYFPQGDLNLVSLDIEGLDFDVLKTWNFSKSRPAVFCLETLTYSVNNTEEKIKEIISYMIKKDYFVYADTYINTIFVCNQAWKERDH